MTDLILHYSPSSFDSQVVLLTLIEKTVPFSGLIVDTGDLSQIDPNYVRKASICGVPMLEHDENVVVGLRKIISYIADTFGGADLTQGDAAQIDHWMTRVETAHIEELTLATPPYPIPFPRMFSRRRLKQQIDVANRLARDVHELGDIYREHVRVLRHLFRTLGDEWKINDFYRNISVILDALELQLKTTPFAAGKAYSIADVYMTAFLARLNALGLGYLWEQEDRPSVFEYAQRVKSRPSYAKVFDGESVPRLFSDSFFLKTVLSRVAIPGSVVLAGLFVILLF
jgi:glutathione S-transferase